MRKKTEIEIKAEIIPPIDDVSDKIATAHKTAVQLHAEGKMTDEEFSQLDDALILREKKFMTEGR